MADKQCSRRQFLGALTATVAAPYIITRPSWAQPGRPAASNRIVMGCIGVGGMGTGNMHSFLGNGDVQIVGVCDVDKGNAERAKGEVDKRYSNSDCEAYTDFRELLSRTDIDAISLATPDHWHAIPAIMAAKAGMDIYGEKPISHSLLEGRAMADAVKKYGRVWQTGSWQRS